MMSRAISVGAGELGSDDVCWDGEGSGVVSIGAKVKIGRFFMGVAAGGAADGEGTEAEGVIGVGSGDSAWRRFPSNEIEEDGFITAGEYVVAVMAALVASDMTTSSSARECDGTRPNVLSRRRNGIVDVSL
jgi:hypothetical protein